MSGSGPGPTCFGSEEPVWWALKQVPHCSVAAFAGEQQALATSVPSSSINTDIGTKVVTCDSPRPGQLLCHVTPLFLSYLSPPQSSTYMC